MKTPAVASTSDRIEMCPVCYGKGHVYKETDYNYHTRDSDYTCERCTRCSGHGLVRVKTTTYVPHVEETPYDPTYETTLKVK